eukprot:6200979-Pleurochrysis_carterae.AAC.1
MEWVHAAQSSIVAEGAESTLGRRTQVIDARGDRSRARARQAGQRPRVRASIDDCPSTRSPLSAARALHATNAITQRDFL